MAQQAWQQRGDVPETPQELNRYAYARNNPLRYTDPAGQHPCVAFLMGGPVGAGVAASCALFFLGVVAVTYVTSEAIRHAVEEGQSLPLPPLSADTGGQPASPGGLDPDPSKWGPEQEQAVRDMLRREYEQRYGESDAAIRTNLGLTGRVADFVGYNAHTRRWLIAESKGEDFSGAVEQLENTMRGLLAKDPSSIGRIDLRIYTNSNQYARLAEKGLEGYRINSEGFLGWLDKTNTWHYQEINGSRILVQTAP